MQNSIFLKQVGFSCVRNAPCLTASTQSGIQRLLRLVLHENSTHENPAFAWRTRGLLFFQEEADLMASLDLTGRQCWSKGIVIILLAHLSLKKQSA